MQLNKILMYIHRVFIVLFAIVLVGMLIGYFLHYVHSSPIRIALMTIIYLGLSFLHFKAAQEVAKGTQKGRILSLILACILLILFPIGTIVGAVMLYLLTPKKWQLSTTELR